MTWWQERPQLIEMITMTRRLKNTMKMLSKSVKGVEELSCQIVF